MKSNETLNLIEEITRNDGSKYYEVSDIAQNGRAELAANSRFYQKRADFAAEHSAFKKRNRIRKLHQRKF